MITAQEKSVYIIDDIREVSLLSPKKKLTGILRCFLPLDLGFLDILMISSKAMSIFFSVRAIASVVRGLVAI